MDCNGLVTGVEEAFEEVWCAGVCLRSLSI